MSRTKRKRPISYEEFNFNPYIITHLLKFGGDFQSPYQYNLVESKKMKPKYYADGFYNSTSFPKIYRKIVNNKRRNKDKVSLFREVNYNLDVLYCSWNCKSNQHWIYW